MTDPETRGGVERAKATMFAEKWRWFLREVDYHGPFVADVDALVAALSPRPVEGATAGIRPQFLADVEAALRAFITVTEEQAKCEACDADDQHQCVGHGDAWGDIMANARGALFRLDRERLRRAPAPERSE